MTLPRIRLLVGPGTLPSRGKDRMDLTNYRRSGHPRMTAAELLAAIPEVEQIASVEPEGGAPYEIATLEDLREAIRRRTLVELKEAMERMAAVEGPVMTPQEIEEEIDAARAERRVREARAART